MSGAVPDPPRNSAEPQDRDPGKDSAWLDAIFRGVIDQSEEGIFLIDRATMRYIDVNPALCHMLGYSRDEIMARGPVGSAQAAGATARQLQQEYDELIARSPARISTLSMVRHANGRMLRVQRSRQALHVAGRWVIAATIRDVSQEQANLTRLEQFRSALDRSADAIMLVDCSTAVFIDFNQRTCELLGYSREELMKLGPHHTSLLYPTQEAYRDFLGVAVAQHPSILTSESQRRRKDGSLVPLEFTTYTLWSDQRWIAVVTARDITERQLARDGLQRFRAVVDQAADAILLVDPTTQSFVDVNHTALRLLGYERANLLTLPTYRMTAKLATREQAEEHDRRIIEQAPGDVVDQEEFIRSDGTVIPVEVTRRAVHFGGHWTIVVTAHDLRERLAARAELDRRMAELARSNRDLEQFAYITSHDLTEPLRMVSAYTELLSRRYANRLDGDAREFMGYITGGATRMRRLIEDLLRYSRAGRTAKQPVQVPIDEVLAETLSNLEQLILRERATVTHDPMPTVLADRTSMTQLLQNLIGNGIKFHGEQAPRVHVGCQRTDSEQVPGWTFTVSDNGIGIDPRHFERIFLVFQRLHSREDYEGTGIGLSICKRLVEHRGGRIWLESSPGKGTSFHFTVPDEVPHPSSHETTGDKATSSGRPI